MPFIDFCYDSQARRELNFQLAKVHRNGQLHGNGSEEDSGELGEVIREGKEKERSGVDDSHDWTGLEGSIASK